jgi:DNA-binding transcriptional regulator LsrR (DeoR family)
MVEHAADGRRLAHSDDNLRLMVKVARMYHEQDHTQSQIAETLHISQARVSRLLRSATELGIVRTIVTLPPGIHTDIEEALTAAYAPFGLVDAVVVESAGLESDPSRGLGAAAAQYLEATLKGGELVGISSWSATLLAAVEAMRPARGQTADRVVQIVGGLGDPRVQMQASRLLGLFASCTGAAPIFMPAPGMLGSRDARDSLTADATVSAVMDLWSDLTLALVGIGGIEGSRLLRESGNALSEADRKMLKKNGAVGDVCLRFYDAEGRAIESSVDDRVMGITHDALLRIPRRVGVAGGSGKHAAIRGAMLGGWINVLITDLDEAERLIKSAPRP